MRSDYYWRRVGADISITGLVASKVGLQRKLRTKFAGREDFMLVAFSDPVEAVARHGNR